MIIVGLYMVLWGKSKDQLPFKVRNDELPTSNQNSTTTNQQLKPSDQQLKAAAPTTLSNNSTA